MRQHLVFFIAFIACCLALSPLHAQEELDIADFFADEESEELQEPEEPKQPQQDAQQQPLKDIQQQQTEEIPNLQPPSEEMDDFEQDMESSATVRTNFERGTRYIIISGFLGVNFSFRDDFFADAVLGPDTTDLDEDFFDPRLGLHFDIQLQNNIRAAIEIENEERDEQLHRSSRGNHYITSRTSPDNFQFDFEKAYVEIGEFLLEGVTLRGGIIPHKYALRANGQSFFLDFREAESPFATHSDTHALGVLATYQPIQQLQFYADGFYFVTAESNFSRRDETVTGINLDMYLPKTVQGKDQSTVTLVRFFNLMFAAIQGDNSSPIWCLGLGFDYFVSGSPQTYLVEMYGELLFQFGEYERKNLPPVFSTRDQDHLALGAYLGCRFMYQKSKWQPFIDISYWYISGDDDDPDAGTNRDLVTYENIDSTLIIEDNDYGLDVDSNYWALKVQTGVNLRNLLAEEVQLQFLYALFQTVDSPGGTSHRLGEEFDVRLIWEYTADLNLALVSGYLWNSRHFQHVFDEVGANGKDHAFLLRIEALLHF